MRPSIATAPRPRILRPVEEGDDRAGAVDLFGGRGEDRVGDGDLVRVDQGLAVEAEIAGLLAFGPNPPSSWSAL